jgi:hypothetical protein
LLFIPKYFSRNNHKEKESNISCFVLYMIFNDFGVLPPLSAIFQLYHGNYKKAALDSK